MGRAAREKEDEPLKRTARDFSVSVTAFTLTPSSVTTVNILQGARSFLVTEIYCNVKINACHGRLYVAQQLNTFLIVNQVSH